MKTVTDQGYVRVEAYGLLYGLFIRHDFRGPEKYNFLTPEDHYLQIGINTYEEGDVIQNHVHLPCDRTLDRTEEVIWLRKGRLRAFVFDERKNLLAEHLMETGDLMYLARGGHGFQLLEPCDIFEVKQGPYLSKTADKELFP